MINKKRGVCLALIFVLSQLSINFKKLPQMIF